MLFTIAIILFVLWALGLVGGYALGGLIHLLLVVALIVVALQFLSGRRSV
ncbi:MAG: lmo0937 family membrane protein [Gemmatimonadales bacterium]|nr:MAG: lmo0937 family membrane protein [Gemmatimonadales bacterium]